MCSASGRRARPVEGAHEAASLNDCVPYKLSAAALTRATDMLLRDTETGLLPALGADARVVPLDPVVVAVAPSMSWNSPSTRTHVASAASVGACAVGGRMGGKPAAMHTKCGRRGRCGNVLLAGGEAGDVDSGAVVEGDAETEVTHEGLG